MVITGLNDIDLHKHQTIVMKKTELLVFKQELKQEGMG